VQLAAADLNMPGGEEALDRFRAYFSVGEMTKEAEVLFSCTPDGTLSSRVKGEDKEAIQSPALCWALFDVYLGRKPISGNGKKSLIANFPPPLAPRSPRGVGGGEGETTPHAPHPGPTPRTHTPSGRGRTTCRSPNAPFVGR
jgi:hypothetical protein